MLTNPRKVPSPVLLVLLAVGVAIAAAPQASATTIVPQSIDTMVQRAHVVVRAIPVADSAVSSWDEGHRLIVTRTKLKVLETFCGDAQADAEIEVETLGGFIESEKIELYVPGSPVFRPNEQVVLFLYRNGVSGALRPLDLAAGKFEVTEKDGRQVISRRDLGGCGLAGTRTTPTGLSALTDEIRDAVKHKEAQKAAAESKAPRQEVKP